MAPGDVVYATFTAARPVPTKKYLIVIDPQAGLGLLINTERGFKPEADVMVTPDEVGGCLSYTSFLRTGEVFAFSPVGAEVKGKAATSVGEKVVAALLAHGQMPQQHADLVADAFGLPRPVILPPS